MDDPPLDPGAVSVLRRGRVALRPARPDDAPQLLRWRAEASVRRYQPLATLEEGQLRDALAAQRPADLFVDRGERFDWIIEVDGTPGGWVTLVIHSWEHGLAEWGYALSTPFQGRGVMSEALALLRDALFARTTVERLEARCAVGNEASRRLLEKLGFVREGLLREYFRMGDVRVDNYLYAALSRRRRTARDPSR